MIIAVAVDATVSEAQAEARRYELSHVIVDEGSALADAFDARGTPSGMLVDDGGKVASWVAAGADAIRQLVHAAVQPAPVSIGTPVPELDVPTLDGATVLLDQDRMLAGAFGAHGTPMAVLLAADGTVASGVAAGSSDVFDLLTPLPSAATANTVANATRAIISSVAIRHPGTGGAASQGLRPIGW